MRLATDLSPFSYERSCRLTAVAAGILIAFSQPVFAADVEVRFTGEVVTVGAGVSAGFTVGNAMTGAFRYDTDTLPRSTTPTTATYDGLSLEFVIGSYAGSDASLAEGGSVQVTNDFNGADQFQVFSTDPVGPAVGGLDPLQFRFQLYDPSATVFTNTTLPETLSLDAFDSDNTGVTYVTLNFGTTVNVTNQVRAQITALEVVPYLNIADVATRWRWFGIKENPDSNCPPIALPDWIEGHVFGNINNPLAGAPPNAMLPPALKQYCLYRLPPGVPVQDADVAAIENLTSMGLSAVGTDFLAVTPPETTGGRASGIAGGQNRRAASLKGGEPDPVIGLEASIYNYLASHFASQVGRPDTEPPYSAEGGSAVRLSLMDTHPDTFEESMAAGQSLHGLTLLTMADNLLAGNSLSCLASEVGGPDAQCVAQLAARVALAFRCFEDGENENPGPACNELTDGGYIGLIGRLARAISDELVAWQAQDPMPHGLVLNLSVGWNPIFGGTETLVSDMPVPIQAVYSALEVAACQGALTIVAAGNTINGPDLESGPTLPAAWVARKAPGPARCAKLLGSARQFRTDDAAFTARPLLYAAGGIRANDERLFNSRPQGEPRFVVFSDHAVAAEGSSDPDTRFATLTGNSVSALVLSATAAAVWHYRFDLTAPEVMEAIYESGTGLGRAADVYLPEARRPEVRRIRLCEAVLHACTGPAGGDCPATAPACPALTELSRAEIEAALSDFGCDAAGENCKEFDVGANLTSVIKAPAECGTEILSYSGAPPTTACPHRQLLGLLAKAAVGQQPCDAACPSCTMASRSPGTMYVEIDDMFQGTLRETLIKCGDLTFAIPVDIFLDRTFVQAGDKFKLTNLDAICAESDPVSLIFAVDNPGSSMNVSLSTTSYGLVVTGCGVADRGFPNDAIFGEEMFVRGSFNDWLATPEARFINFGTGEFVAEFELEAGTWDFKIADAGWTLEYDEPVQTLPLDTPVMLLLDMPANGGANLSVTVPEDGCYRWSMMLGPGSPPADIQLTIQDLH